MITNMLASATAISNRDLLDRLPRLAACERTTAAQLVAHLAALDMRPDVYAAEGYGSLFAYCTRALRLSEDAACTRLAAVSACRRFPRILDQLASGTLSLTAVRRIGPHLTAENSESVLARAANRTRSEIDALVAELSPQPDVTPAVRKVPVRAPAAPLATPSLQMLPDSSGPASPTPLAAPRAVATCPPAPATRRPVVQPSAPERYRMQFTIGREAYEQFRRLQALLRREIPSGDPGLIFEQSIGLLLEKVERSKLGRAAKPRQRAAIRSETYDSAGAGAFGSRHIPNEVRRAVWTRDGGRCAYVSGGATRCAEKAYLEFHHLVPYARGGLATVENIALRCSRHNQYEARLVFGGHGESGIGEARALYTAEGATPRVSTWPALPWSRGTSGRPPPRRAGRPRLQGSPRARDRGR
jgi:5-methylcytosine-specific restriction endonuclease McrA